MIPRATRQWIDSYTYGPWGGCKVSYLLQTLSGDLRPEEKKCIHVLLTSCNIDFFFPLNLGESRLGCPKVQHNSLWAFPIPLDVPDTKSLRLLTRDQPDLIWTPHTDWKYSISQDPSHIHQTQTSGLPIVRLAVLSQHGSLLVCHNCLGRQATIAPYRYFYQYVPEPLYFSSIRSICNILEFHEG